MACLKVLQTLLQVKGKALVGIHGVNPLKYFDLLKSGGQMNSLS